MVAVSVVSTELAALAAMVATGGVLNAVKVHLYQNALTPSKGVALSAFVECNYGGYAAKSVGTWGAPYVAVDGQAHVTAPSLQFQSADAVTVNVAYGVFVTDATSAVLIYAASFDQPVPMVDATTGLVYEPDFTYGA